jgi:hypothetical protein
LRFLEIIIDGLFGTHRIFAEPLGGLYNVLIASFEVLAALVLIGVIVFFARRNIIHLKRFSGTEMGKWPRSDANIILIVEVLLMSAFLTMNAADYKLQQLGAFALYQCRILSCQQLSCSTPARFRSGIDCY